MEKFDFKMYGSSGGDIVKTLSDKKVLRINKNKILFENQTHFIICASDYFISNDILNKKLKDIVKNDDYLFFLFENNVFFKLNLTTPVFEEFFVVYNRYDKERYFYTIDGLFFLNFNHKYAVQSFDCRGKNDC